jgi:hypothetical protein
MPCRPAPTSVSLKLSAGRNPAEVAPYLDGSPRTPSGAAIVSHAGNVSVERFTGQGIEKQPVIRTTIAEIEQTIEGSGNRVR